MTKEQKELKKSEQKKRVRKQLPCGASKAWDLTPKEPERSEGSLERVVSLLDQWKGEVKHWEDIAERTRISEPDVSARAKVRAFEIWNCATQIKRAIAGYRGK